MTVSSSTSSEFRPAPALVSVSALNMTVPNSSFIRIAQVAKEFTAPDASIIAVVEPLSVDIQEGEFVVFVGPSGCGKTTVMRMVGGLETPSAGDIYLNGKRVEGPNRDKGMVFQSYSSFPWLTVLGNIRFGLKYRDDISADEKERIARHYLDLVGLTPFADYTINRISGGMRQRVAIARTLAANPLVGVVMGSASDWDVMQHAVEAGTGAHMFEL